MILAKRLLNILDGMLSFMMGVLLLVTVAWTCYALWDGYQIMHDVQETREALQALKPTTDENSSGEESFGFLPLQQMNGDVCAWLTLENTAIDYPVVQGQNNEEYLSKGADGTFHLGGSIFLDFRNSRDFDESYSLLYGHFMADSGMFGDLICYRDASFFKNNRQGLLLLPDGNRVLHVVCWMQASESEPLIFDPEYAAQNRTQLLDYAEAHAEQMDPEEIQGLRNRTEPILAMTTCTEEPSDGLRMVVLARMEEAV